MSEDDNQFHAKGSFWARVRSVLFLLPAWFAPHKTLRGFFHRLRGVDVGKNTEIGYFCILGNVHPGMIHIHDDAVVTAKVTLLEHDNSRFYTHGEKVRFGHVHVMNGAFVGIGSVVMPGVTVGEKAIIGALSFVSKDVEPGAVVVGAPARVVNRCTVAPHSTLP